MYTGYDKTSSRERKRERKKRERKGRERKDKVVGKKKIQRAKEMMLESFTSLLTLNALLCVAYKDLVSHQNPLDDSPSFAIG